MITDLAYDMIISSAYNLQLLKRLMLINFSISIVQMNKLTLGVCNNPEKQKVETRTQPFLTITCSSCLWSQSTFPLHYLCFLHNSST